MLIIESKKAIFVHIEKCGGTAIEMALDPYLEVYDVRIGGTRFGENVQAHYRKKFGLHKHSKGREIRKILTPEKYNQYFSFAFIRNPISRVVSAYRFLRSGTWNSEVALRVQEMESIKEFVCSNDLNWLCPCYGYIYDGNGNKCVDFVGKVESMDMDFAWLCGRLGLDLFKLEKKNVSNADDPNLLREELLSDFESVNLIRDKFHKDIYVFDYDVLS